MFAYRPAERGAPGSTCSPPAAATRPASAEVAAKPRGQPAAPRAPPAPGEAPVVLDVRAVPPPVLRVPAIALPALVPHLHHPHRALPWPIGARKSNEFTGA